MRLTPVALAAPLTLALVAWAPTAVGQESSSTASYEMATHGISSGQGSSASVGAAYGRVDQVGATVSVDALPALATASYGLELGAASLYAPAYFTLIGLAPSSGAPLTNVIVPLEPGVSGPFTVRFDGILASIVGPAGDNLAVVAPQHAQGPVDVTLDAPAKSVTFEAGFAYVPALLSPPQVAPGEILKLRVAGAPGSTFGVLYAEALGSGMVIEGIAGVLALDLATTHPVGVVALATATNTGSSTSEGFLQVLIPDDPSLVGRTFFLQAIGLEPSVSGPTASFTNHTSLSVED